MLDRDLSFLRAAAHLQAGLGVGGIGLIVVPGYRVSSSPGSFPAEPQCRASGQVGPNPRPILRI